MKVINKDSEKFLEKYLNNPSPTGFESGGQKIWAKYIKPYVDELHLDNYGTCYGVVYGHGDGRGKMKVVIEDSVELDSWVVKFYDGELGQQTVINKLCYNYIKSDKFDILAVTIRKVLAMMEEYKGKEIDELMKNL